jgi:hypothetical protein
MSATVLEALRALYHDENSGVKEAASKWLEEWQMTTAAWSVADGMLHDPNSSVETQYFAAQTLRTKASLYQLLHAAHGSHPLRCAQAANCKALRHLRVRMRTGSKRL